MIHGTSQTWNPDFLEQFPELSSDLSRVTTFVLTSPGAGCAHRETAGHSLRKNLPKAQKRTQCPVFVSKFQVFVVLEDCAEPQNGLGWERFLSSPGSATAVPGRGSQFPRTEISWCIQASLPSFSLPVKIIWAVPGTVWPQARGCARSLCWPLGLWGQRH